MEQSKFFAYGGDSDSSYEEEAVEEVVPQQQTQTRGKFVVAFDSDSESEDEGRVVRSEKDRAWENIFERIVRIRSAMKISDWGAIQDEFDDVNKQIDKSKMLVIQHGLPGFYVKMLCEVEDSVNAAIKDKDAQAKMKPVVLRALNRMKLVVRKHNKKYEAEIARCREFPDEYKDPEAVLSKKYKVDSSASSNEDDSSDESDSDSSSSESSSDSDSGSESEDSLFKGSESDSSSSDDEDNAQMQLPGRAKWLKKAVDTSKQEQRDMKREKKKIASSNAVVSSVVEDDARAVQKVRVEETITEDVFDKKMAELLSARGRKSTDGRTMLRQLDLLSRASQGFGFRKEIPALMFYVSTMYEVLNTTIDTYLDLHYWRTAHRCIMRVVSILNSKKDTVFELVPSIVVSDFPNSKGAELMKKDAEDDEDDSRPRSANVLQVSGNLETFLIKLESEYMKSLQQINPHTMEYVTRLSDEAHLLELIAAVKVYYERVGDYKAAAVMALMQVEHMYYKPDSTALAIHRNKQFGRTADLHPACRGMLAPLPATDRNSSKINPAAYLGDPSRRPNTFDPSQELEQLCTFIYKHGNDRSRTRALLCSVYHKSLHDKYYQARDLFLISHLQDTIDKADTKTQILYNRTLVTLGLSAFRQGLFQRAHDCLSIICSGRAKEMLAQGQTKWLDKDPEQEKAERRRQIPYHMHINQDLLDCCHLLCAMFLELPHLARPNVSTHPISRTFRRYLNMYNNQIFTGPPENTREHVLASAKALLVGDWKKACDYLLNLEVWNLIPNDGGSAVKVMLKSKVQDEALKLYLISFANQYDSISIATLCEMFNLGERAVQKIVSRMIFSNEVSAAWDQGSSSLIFYRNESSTLQNLVLQAAENVAILVESNERILDPLVGAYGYKDDWVRGGDNRKPHDRNVESGGRGSGRGGRGRGEGGRGRGDGGRGRSGPGTDRPYRNVARKTGGGSGTQGNVWSQPSNSFAEHGEATSGGGSYSSNRRSGGNTRPQYSGSSSSYNKTYSVNREQNLSRPAVSSVGGSRDESAAPRKPTNSWMTGN